MTTPDPITRPNGKPYRRRRPIRVEAYFDNDDQTCLVVIGTHDLEAAAELARPVWESDYDPATLPEGVRRWWRLVPWSTGGSYDRSWVDDPVRGRPVITFDAPPW